MLIYKQTTVAFIEQNSGHSKRHRCVIWVALLKILKARSFHLTCRAGVKKKKRNRE